MKHKNLILTTFAIVALLFTSCKKDEVDKPTVSEKKHFLIGNIVGESIYYSTFKDIATEKIDNKQAYEFVKMARPHIYKKMVLFSEIRMGDKIHKYTFDADNNLSPAGSIDMPQASSPSDIFFINDTKAYVNLAGVGKLIIINPTSMEETGEIDLRQYAVGDNNPDIGGGVIRNGKLFLSLNQLKSQYSAHDSAYVAIIDIATNSVDKVIVDERLTSLCFTGHGDMFMDEDKNIYFYSTAIFGYQPGAKEGYLRIKNDETEWDKNFFFSITNTNFPDVPDNKGTYTMAHQYAGNGIVYAMAMIPSLTSNPPDYINDKNYQPCKLDLFNGTIEKINLLPTTGFAAMGIIKKGDEIIFGLSTKNGNGLFTYDAITGATATKATTEGFPLHLRYLGD